MSIQVHYSACDDDAGQIVTVALQRSFTPAQVTVGAAASTATAQVWINPSDDAAPAISALLSGGGKALVLGRLTPRVAEALSLDLQGPLELPSAWGQCAIDPTAHHDESPCVVRYLRRHPLSLVSAYRTRPLCRFDFAHEWNNHGYGRVTLDGSPWSLQSAVSAGDATPLAVLDTPRGARPLYAALSETARGAALWFNRPVGPVDSLEWRMVEVFLADYRADDLPTFPALAELPGDCSAAVCARLDCDEAVATSRELWQLYRDLGIPLSLGLLTGQPIDESDLVFCGELTAAGGAIASHSVRHEPNWGGSYDRAFQEAAESREWLAENLPRGLSQFVDVPGKKWDYPPPRDSFQPAPYAVSPFHQNPTYAVQALADCGYRGFVGGIIANDPQFLLGRAGRVPFVSPPIVSLSTQCMLHGDCFRRYGDSIDPYVESYQAHRAAGSIFGYLDHPFSARYQYGWPDESTRVAAHRQLIERIGTQDDVWWASLSDVLDFLRVRDATQVFARDGKLQVDAPPRDERRPLVVSWKGGRYVI